MGFPRKIIVNEDTQKFSYFYLFNMFIVNFYSKVKVWFIIVFLNIMKLVLSIFRESSFSLNQLEIFLNSIFISFSSWIGSLWEKRILVSSAKIIDPCGTPQTISLWVELVLL